MRQNSADVENDYAFFVARTNLEWTHEVAFKSNKWNSFKYIQ